MDGVISIGVCFKVIAKVIAAMTTNRIITIWALLLLATILTWWLGEGGMQLGRSEIVIAAIVLGLSAFKGVLIALDFMELRHAPPLWRHAVLGWLAAVCLALWVMSVVHALR